MEIEFNAHGNKKQVEAVKYWIDSTTFDIVYGGSKGCLINSTKVRTIDGLVRIDEVKGGDLALTFNESTGRQEYKPIMEIKKFGTGATTEYHKMITFVLRGGQTISLTCNHEIYVKGSWMPAGELARRMLDENSGNRWEVCNFQPWESPIPTEIWTEELYFYKTLRDEKRLLQGLFTSSRISETDIDSPIGCYSFSRQSREQALCEPYRLQSVKQSFVESGMVHQQGEHTTLKRPGASTFWQQERGGEQQYHFDGRAGFTDTSKIQKEDSYKRNIRSRIRSKPGHNQGYCLAKELDTHLIEEVRFELMQGFVYDLCILDNHNYCVTEDSYIVHNSGKSYLGCALILADALMYPGTHYFVARKTLSDLRKHTMTSISEVLNTWKIPESMYKYNGQDNLYVFHNGSRIYFLDCKPMPSDPLYYRFGSIQMTRGFIEECGEVEVAAKNALAATIGRWKNDQYNLAGKLLMTCNPAKNFLYSEYYKPHTENRLEPWKKFIQALPQDNKRLPVGYLENLDRTLNENEKKRLLRGIWEYDDDPSVLIQYDSIRKIFTNTNVIKGNKYITVDLARLGGDKVVMITWDGFDGTVKSWSNEKLNVTFDRIERERVAFGCSKQNVLIDADGMGHGMPDFTGYTGFRNNSPSLPDPLKKRDFNGHVIRENFDNLKSQCGFRMAEMINDGAIHISCEEKDVESIVQELEQVKQKPGYEGDNKKGLLGKDEVRKILQRSPDFWDAILMRVFFELRTRRMRIIHRTGNERPVGEYGLKRRYDAENSY